MTAAKYGRIEIGSPCAHATAVSIVGRTIYLRNDMAALLRSALSDLTASTPTVDGPEGLTGPSAEGTWYGTWDDAKDLNAAEWAARFSTDDEWEELDELAGHGPDLVEFRPVPLPVTEEVPLHELIGRKLPGERWKVKSLDLKWVEAGSVLAAQCYPAGVEFLGSTKAVPVSPSGTVTVQREATS